jgi:uncharacterized protein (DUF2236 family)
MSVTPGPGSITWRVAGDWTKMLGGGRALILQVAHPVVAAGVGQHSDYESAPWQRLNGTLDLYLRVIFGGRGETPEQAGERLRELHKRIKGTDSNGNRYHALDPSAFHWVHATLVDTMVEMQRRFRTPLNTLELELFYEEMRAVGTRYGLRERDMPAEWAEFRDYFDGMVASELEDSELLQNVIRTVFNPSRPPLLPIPDGLWGIASWPGAELVRLTTTGSLPRPLRARFGLRWSREQKLALRAQQEAIRRVFPRLPDRLRLMPPALAAKRGETRAAAA